MKLTEKELNYILTESLQNFLNENTPNINTKIKKNIKGEIKGVTPINQTNDISKDNTQNNNFKKWGRRLGATVGGVLTADGVFGKGGGLDTLGGFATAAAG